MNNSKVILALVFLIAGTLLTTTAITTMVPAAYADNKQKAEDESAAAIADCDDNDVERAGFDCFGIAINDIEVSEEDGGGEEIVLCHNPANGPPQTLTVQNEQQAEAHLGEPREPGHEDDHLGECRADET
jgi:hypothetical protein